MLVDDTNELVYDWMRDLAVDISVKSGKNKICSTAWRVAAKKGWKTIG